MKVHHLEVEKDRLSESELHSRMEYLAILEYQRLKEMPSSTNLSDTLLLKAAVAFSQIPVDVQKQHKKKFNKKQITFSV